MAERNALTTLEPQEITEFLDPNDLVRIATKRATVLAQIIEDQKLYTQIGKRKHVHVEAWTALAALNGFAVVENPERCHKLDGGGWIATAKLVRLRDMKILGEASHICGTAGDGEWVKKPDPDQRSMAVTRAAGKVCRLVFSWIMVLSGYSPTPFEEMGNVPTGAATHRKPSDVPCVPFGKNKGTPVTELDMRQLDWYIQRAQEKGETEWEQVVVNEKKRRENPDADLPF